MTAFSPVERVSEDPVVAGKHTGTADNDTLAVAKPPQCHGGVGSASLPLRAEDPGGGGGSS
jgi:hypothetical protein